MYIYELMLIEKDSRRHIANAIKLEKEISRFETQEKLKGSVVINCKEFNLIRKQFVAKCCHLNAIANSEGKGRDDLGVEILIEAENILRKVSENKSKAIRKLAENIKKAFLDIRMLLRRYEENMDSVDPQLRNNPELVNNLVNFEKSWEKGKQFLVNATTSAQLIYFSELIECLTEKHKDLQEKIESMDTEIFVILPCFIVLSSLDGSDKGICSHYFPVIQVVGNEEQVHYSDIKNKYNAFKKKCKDSFEIYKIFEQAILDKEINPIAMKKCGLTHEDIFQILNSIKRIAMGMQRHFPADWNSLLETAIGQFPTK